MRLDLVKGSETSLIIDDVDVSIEKGGFLAESYSKAKAALKEYISQADHIRDELRKEKSVSGVNDCLYRSPQNIIAFSGKRGTGKTSTMLSFSRFLAMKNSTVQSEVLPSRDVVILDPIDPTMLENDQNILNVVLSRILYKAEEVWTHTMDYNRRYQDKEKEKNELLSAAKKCLNGIAAIKSKSSIETLADLQKIGDSAILKRDFFELVELFNRFCVSSENTVSNHHLLVLQIDDTDCQIDKGYQVLEDIRKYLTIPNVVILMAMDIDIMRLVLTQHYIERFHYGLEKEFIRKDETRKYADKYMAKMLPPSHKIYLPLIDEIIRDEPHTIELGYYEAEDVDKKYNLLKKGKSFQTKVLNYIYQKTHLVFAAHNTYLNNIVPTTLRGLMYFLHILGSMEDVPAIDILNINNREDLTEKLEKQFPILEKNLDIFEEYFMNDWIQAKLSHEMVDIIKRISNQVPEERIPYAYNELLKYYNKRGLKWDNPSLNNKPTYYDLDCLLQRIHGDAHDLEDKGDINFRQSDDFYNTFSIRTLLSIKNNKDMIKIKKHSIKNSSNSNVVLDCTKIESSLPDSLYLDGKSYGKHTLIDRGWDKKYNFTNDILACLFDAKIDFKDKDQQQIFMKQEIAALIACNFDVQEVLRKVIKNMEEESCESLKEAVETDFKRIQENISKINDGMLSELKEKGDISPFNYTYCQNEIDQRERERAKERERKRKEKDFMEIRSMFEQIKKYPTPYNETRINKIKSTSEEMIKKVSDYASTDTSINSIICQKKVRDLFTQLKEHEFIEDEKDSSNDRQEYEQLMHEISELLRKIKP